MAATAGFLRRSANDGDFFTGSAAGRSSERWQDLQETSAADWVLTRVAELRPQAESLPLLE